MRWMVWDERSNSPASVTEPINLKLAPDLFGTFN